MSTTPLKIAVQKSGRLAEDSLRLLADAGLGVPQGSGRLKTPVSGFPAELLFLRDDDIPQYVADGVAEVGIVGQNVVAEKAKPVTPVLPLGFGICRLSLAVRAHVDYPGTAFFQGKRIATSYPRVLAQFLAQHGVQAEIHEISGSVEIAPSIGLADGICDLVSTGSTLFQNGLKEVVTVLESQALLVKHPGLGAHHQGLLDELVFRMQAVRQAKRHRYVLFNAPNENLQAIIALVPGMRSPSILPLAEPGWSSVHSVISETDFWEIIGKIKAHGAQGILVTPIEKMVV